MAHGEKICNRKGREGFAKDAKKSGRQVGIGARG